MICHTGPLFLGIVEGLHQFLWIVGAHQRLTDEDRICAAGTRPLGVFRLKNPTFTDPNNRIRYLWYEGFGYSEIGLEPLEITVVHTDNFWIKLKGFLL